MGDDLWYLSRNNESFGPYSQQAILEMKQSGNLFQGDLIWNPFANEWQSPQQLDFLKRGAPDRKKTLIVLASFLIVALLASGLGLALHYSRQKPLYGVASRASKSKGGKFFKIVDYFPQSGPAGSSIYVQFEESIKEMADTLTAWHGKDPLPLIVINEKVVQVILPQETGSGKFFFSSGQGKSSELAFTVLDATFTPLLIQELHPSSSVQTISYKDEISVNIPPGILDKPRNLSISKMDHAPAFHMEPFGISSSYDIKIDGLEQLSDYIKISVPYTLEHIDPNQALEDQFLALRWDDELKSWQELPFNVDKSKQRIEFITNHLSWFQTFLSVPTAAATLKAVAIGAAVAGSATAGVWIAESVTLSTYTTPQKNFKLTYNKRVWDVYEQYTPWQKPQMASNLSSYNPAYPNYIQDIGEIFELAYKNYMALGFKNPVDVPGRVWGTWHSPISVKISGIYGAISNMGAVERSASYDKVFGGLHFPHELFMNISSTPNKVYSTVGHELFHRLQAEYYGARKFYKGFMGSGDYWWIEACAEYAGCMVAFGSTQFESELKEGFAPDYFDFCLDSFDKKGVGGSSREHQYVTSNFIDFLVKKKGFDFKQMVERVSQGNALATLDDYAKEVNIDDGLLICHRDFFRWAIFSNSGLLAGQSLGSFVDQVADRRQEICFQKDTLTFEKGQNLRITKSDGKPWVDLMVLKENTRAEGSKYSSTILMTDDEYVLQGKNIKAGDVLYILASNATGTDHTIDISVKLDKKDQKEEVECRFDLPGNYSAKLWAIKLLQTELIIKPDAIAMAEINKEYTFEFILDGISSKTSEIDFEWDFWDNDKDSKGEERSIVVKKGQASHKVSYTYLNPPPLCAVKVKARDSHSGDDIAEAEISVNFGGVEGKWSGTWTLLYVAAMDKKDPVKAQAARDSCEQFSKDLE
jgi:hypothetical protein